MYSHRPRDYQCPFCQIASGVERPGQGTKQADIVYQNFEVTAFIASRWWPRNKGHVLVVPNVHYENIFDLPADAAKAIHEAAQDVAWAMKATYGCTGISTRQHNEPDGNQDVWHYHLHVFPRYPDDRLYLTQGYQTQPAERVPYAHKLRGWLESQPKE